MKKENAEAQYSWQEKAWKILGLIPPSMDVKGEMKELLLEQIGGFYDPDTKELKVMRGFGGSSARSSWRTNCVMRSKTNISISIRSTSATRSRPPTTTTASSPPTR